VLSPRSISMPWEPTSRATRRPPALPLPRASLRSQLLAIVRPCLLCCSYPSLRSCHTPPRSPSPSSLRVTAQCHRPSPCPGRASRARPPARQLHGIHCRAQRVLQTEAFSSSTEPSGARLNFQVVELPETECMHLRAPATSTRLNRTPSSS
jgi:hypothetical protein